MKRWLKNNAGFLVFLLCFGFFRTAIADWNPIPSASMRPTLLEGDVVLVDRLAYDFKIPLTGVSLARLSEPRRGDVVTFSSPKDGTRLIKRLVAIPGDTIAMRNEILYINGEAASYSDPANLSEQIGPGVSVAAVGVVESVGGSARAVQFLPDIDARRSFGPMLVPADHYFMLGDNRDNSEDSRFIGFVPRHLIIGHAHRILVSANITGNWLPRFERTISSIR